MPNIVQIRKKGGLDHIVVDKKSGKRLHPELYYQKMKNTEEDGIPMGDYKEGMILDAKHWLAPFWNKNKNKWSWGADAKKLVALIDKMKLRYPKWHENSGQLLKPHKDGNEHLTDYYDPVFRHDMFYGKQYLQDSRGKFDLDDPYQEFMQLCTKGRDRTIDKSEGGQKVVSKYSAGLVYELISPTQENKDRVVKKLKQVESVKMVGALHGKEDRIRAICEALDLVTYRDTVDTESAWMMLMEAAENTEKSVKYNGKSLQDMLMEYGSMSNDDLNLIRTLIAAQRKGVIRKYTDYYLVDGEKIHVKNHVQLIKYFNDPKNSDTYLKVMDLLNADKYK